MESQLETRLQNRIERRDMVQAQHEELLRERGEGDLSDADKKQIEVWRGAISDLDQEIEQLTDDVEAHKRAAERSKALVRARLGSTQGVDQDGDGIVYRDFYTYARDYVLTRDLNTTAGLAKQWARDDQEVMAMRQRLDLLKRTPANTLSSNVAGLTPAQHIAQIFQVINNERPLVASARRTTLERGQLTYPVVTQRPVVAVQGTEKTEAGNQGMIIDMLTATASTYLGGGDISWQAANWSTPDALQTWFDLAAADYALKTEQDAAQALQHSGFTYNISSTLSGSYSFANLMTAVGAGYSDVFTNSGRIANTVWMAPDVFGYLLGLTSNAFTQFTNVSGSNVGPLNIVVSRGMDSGVAVVGDSAGLLVAETAGAPVELRVTEPAIGGFEVGIIGAFEAVVVDPGAFAMITTAS
jgi:HK97 family phage major capsid protein